MRSLTSLASTVSGGAGCGVRSSESAVTPMEGSSVCKVAITYERKRTGSLSSDSSESQAAGVPLSASHCASTVVLPNPAQAGSGTRAARGDAHMQLSGNQGSVVDARHLPREVEHHRALPGCQFIDLPGRGPGQLVDGRFLHCSFLVSHGWVLLYSRRLGSNFTAHILHYVGK